MEGQASRRGHRHVREHHGRGQGARPTTASRRRTPSQVVEHILREHGPDTEILFGPDMFLGAYVEKTTGRALHVWDGECHVHAGIRPATSRTIEPRTRRRLPDPPGVRLLDLGHGVRRLRRRRLRGRPHALHGRDDRLRRRRRAAPRSWPPRPGCSTRCEAAPGRAIHRRERAAACRYMKMITLPKLRDALRDMMRARSRSPRTSPRARAPDRAHDRHLLTRGRRGAHWTLITPDNHYVSRLARSSGPRWSSSPRPGSRPRGSASTLVRLEPGGGTR